MRKLWLRLLVCSLLHSARMSDVLAQTPLVTWQTIDLGLGGSGILKPVINDSGQVTYPNKTNGFSLGVAGTPVQRNLQPYLLSSGLGLDTAYVVAGDNGRVGYLLGKGIIDDSPSATQVLAAENGQVPGLPAGVQFNLLTFSSGYFCMTPSGVYALPSILKGAGITSSGSTGINDQVVLRGPSGGLQPIAQAGGAAPGLPAGYLFVGQLTRRFDTVINRDGVTAIRARATLWNPPNPFAVQNADGIWLHDPVGGLRLAVTAVSSGANPLGDTAPGTDGARFSAITLGPSINDEGYIAFAASTFNFSASPPTKTGIWSGPTNDLRPVHLFGMAVPGMAGVVFSNPVNNAAIKLGVGRTVCFSTLLAGTGLADTNNIGVFIGTSTNDARLLARIGTQAPGMPAGVNFASLPGDTTVVFGSNRVAIKATVTGPGVTPGVNDRGLWVTDNAGDLKLAVRATDVAPTDHGDQLMAGDFVIQHGTGRDGLPSSGGRADRLAVFNNGVVNGSYAYVMTVGTPAPSAPTLNRSFGGGQLTFSWPAGFKLQRTTSLSPTNWTSIATNPPLVVPATNQQGYFRLAWP